MNMDPIEAPEPVKAPGISAADPFQNERFGQSSAGAVGLLDRVKDTADVHPIQLGGVDANADPGKTTFKLQDSTKPEYQGLSPREMLSLNGMPADNAQGQQDKFINKVIDNTLINDAKNAGINVPENPTDSQLGQVSLQLAISQKILQNGEESVREEIGVDKNASMDEMVKKLGEQIFPVVSKESDVPIKDFDSFYKLVRESAAAPVRVDAGVKRPD